MGRNKQNRIAVPPGWFGRLKAFCRNKWEKHSKPGDVFDIYEFVGLDRRTITTARQLNEFTESSFDTLVAGVGCETPDALLAVLEPPPTASDQLASLGKAFASMFDEKLLSDHMTGVGFAEWMRSEDDWERLVRSGKTWLEAHPEDLYCRGMLLWSVLRKGNPAEMVGVLNETAAWLGSPLPKPSTGSDSTAWQQKINAKIAQLRSGAMSHPDFARWYVEDTLVRATLLRCLRFQEKGSYFEREFMGLGGELEKQTALKVLFDAARSEKGDTWVGAAVDHVSRWASFEEGSGLARLSLLWFTGRQGHPDKMQSALEQSFRWLARSPNQTLVRWAATWLAGLSPEGETTSRLIEDTAEWLGTGAPDDERLVRMGFLWLVGARGSPEQVRAAMLQTAAWLKAHPKDDFIRVAHLLFLIRRRGTQAERKQIADATRAWLCDHHPDVYGLTNLALRLFESAPS